jgi:hypothetical protein
MPPITPAVTSRSKNGADTRWIFDGENGACLLGVFPLCFPKVYASSAASLRSLLPSGSQRLDPANVQAQGVFSSLPCALQRHQPPDFYAF